MTLELIMHGAEHANPSLVIAIALAAGIVAQALARHARLPGIVMLIATGVVLGPDVTGIIDPSHLGASLHDLVGFAIAVILFEGGLNLEMRRLRGEAGTIRRLVTIGALITWAGGTAAARWILHMDWTIAVLCGSLVIVTGPTVITPIVRRIRLKHNLATILEAEGVFIDAVGALIAVVALEVLLSFSEESLALGFVSLPTRLVIGAVAGTIGGLAMALLLRVRGVVPDGFENVFTLCLAWAVFHGSNAISAESGIVAVIVAGFVLGNSGTEIKHELREFKEQLTVMLIGLLFILLAADVRLADVFALGWPGVAVVACLMFVVRPVQVILCTLGSGLKWREKAFLSWLAPRGIVAAAVATVFYERMASHHVEGGSELRGLVFLVIALTVIVQGGLAGLVAGWLGVRRPSNQGYVILGAGGIAIELAKLLRDAREEVVMVDTNPELCLEAQEEGFRVFHGNALEERILLAADLDTRKGVLAMLRNDGVNLLFARKAKSEHKVPRAFVAVQRGPGAITEAMIREAGADMMFHGEFDLELWSVRLKRDQAFVGLRELGTLPEPEEGADPVQPTAVPKELTNLLMPLAVQQDETVVPFTTRTSVSEGDHVFWLIHSDRGEAAQEWLTSCGWKDAAVAPPAEEPSPA